MLTGLIMAGILLFLAGLLLAGAVVRDLAGFSR